MNELKAYLEVFYNATIIEDKGGEYKSPNYQ